MFVDTLWVFAEVDPDPFCLLFLYLFQFVEGSCFVFGGWVFFARLAPEWGGFDRRLVLLSTLDLVLLFGWSESWDKRICTGLLTFWSLPCYIEAHEKDVVGCLHSNDVGVTS